MRQLMPLKAVLKSSFFVVVTLCFVCWKLHFLGGNALQTRYLVRMWEIC